MTGKPKVKLSARDLAVKSRAGNIGVRYPPNGEPAQIRIEDSKRRKGRRR